MTTSPKIESRTYMNMDGRDFTLKQSILIVDGEETEIVLTVRTNGRKGGYKTTERVLEWRGQELDLLKDHPEGKVDAWILERARGET